MGENPSGRGEPVASAAEPMALRLAWTMGLVGFLLRYCFFVRATYDRLSTGVPTVSHVSEPFPYGQRADNANVPDEGQQADTNASG